MLAKLEMPFRPNNMDNCYTEDNPDNTPDDTHDNTSDDSDDLDISLQLPDYMYKDHIDGFNLIHLLPYTWFKYKIDQNNQIDVNYNNPNILLIDKFEWFSAMSLVNKFNIIKIFRTAFKLEKDPAIQLWRDQVKDKKEYVFLAYKILEQSVENTNVNLATGKTNSDGSPLNSANTDPIIGKKYTRKSISMTQRIRLWNHYFNDQRYGACYCCERKIEIIQFEAGHNIAVVNGGTNELANLRPVCSICNKSMGTENLEDFKKRLN